MNYKKNFTSDEENIKNYINDYGKIIPRRITGLKLKTQRRISKKIKTYRCLGIFSYTYKNI